MAERTVVVFGAGASKACGGPLTWEILPMAFEHAPEIEREDYFPDVEKFLVENFHLPPDRGARHADHYPPLPLLISLLDKAIDQKHNLSAAWDPAKLAEVRAGLDYMIFALLDLKLRSLTGNPVKKLLRRLCEAQGASLDVISLNYDIIADNSMSMLSEEMAGQPECPPEPGYPDYGCDVATPMYRERTKFGRLLKLHGSLNWLYCPACLRLDVGISQSGRSMAKMLNELYMQDEQRGTTLEERYTCHGSPCLDCGTSVRPVMITPTHMKDYRNPHVSQVWYGASRALRTADRAILVGYSLPEDDVDVIYLLKRGLSHLPPDRITVVDYDAQFRPPREHPAGARYCTLFGDGIDWHPEGFEAWLGN